MAYGAGNHLAPWPGHHTGAEPPLQNGFLQGTHPNASHPGTVVMLPVHAPLLGMPQPQRLLPAHALMTPPGGSPTYAGPASPTAAAAFGGPPPVEVPHVEADASQAEHPLRNRPARSSEASERSRSPASDAITSSSSRGSAAVRCGVARAEARASVCNGLSEATQASCGAQQLYAGLDEALSHGDPHQHGQYAEGMRRPASSQAWHEAQAQGPRLANGMRHGRSASVAEGVPVYSLQGSLHNPSQPLLKQPVPVWWPASGMGACTLLQPHASFSTSYPSMNGMEVNPRCWPKVTSSLAITSECIFCAAVICLLELSMRVQPNHKACEA